MKVKCWREGSFTVEAAFVVPFGFLVLMSFSCLFQMILHQNDMQMCLVRAVQTYSSTESTVVSAEVLLREHVLLHWDDTADGKICSAKSVQGIPFLGSRFFQLNHYQQMVASNYHGVSMKTADERADLVYVAANGRVYHRNRECTYLKVRIQSFRVRELDIKRNQSGGKYYPCESCCGGAEQEREREVYIASYGDRYHINAGCPKLKRTVREVPLSEIGGLPPCSKCG